ncbi:MAG: RNA methyltransferase [bacterium]
MRQFKSESRLNKIKDVIFKRQSTLTVILENIHDRHNVSAILRSSDSVGVSKVSLLYNVEKFPKLSRTSSASSNKWIDIEYSKSTEECFDELRKKGFKIYVSKVSKDAKSLYDIDFTQKVAVLFGNEHRGVSESAENLCDELFFIPMHGMAQSLNVSVAAAVTLYEAQRQRNNKGMYDVTELSQEDFDRFIDKWCIRR